MKKIGMGILLLAAMMILHFPMQAHARNIPEGQILPNEEDTEDSGENWEGYCAYAIDCKLYAFAKPGENQDPESFLCDFNSDDIANKEFQYLKNVTQTEGNVHYIFILDNSGTMSRYKEEIGAYFQAISENEGMKPFYTLATFGERFDVVKEKMTDINTLLHELDQLSFLEDYTDPYTAVKSVDVYLDSYLRGAEDLVSVVLITDGQPCLIDTERESALAQEAYQVILDGTDMIYSTLCTESWTETGEECLAAGKGLHELVRDAEEASDAGKRMAGFIDSLYCVCFELERAPYSDFSFDLILGFGKDYDGNPLDADIVPFHSIHNIKIQNLDVLPSAATEEFPEGIPGFGDAGIPSAGNDPEESEEGPEDRNMDVGTEEDKSAVLLVVSMICGAVAVIAVVTAVLVIRKKGGKNVPQKQASSKQTDRGILLKLEVYSGRCRNKTAYFQLSDSLTIGSSFDCDIIFDNPEVAAKNACIKLVNGQVYIEDLNSPQGTTLDGMRFQGQNKLRGGEVISIGTVEFSVFFDPGSAMPS